MEQHPVPQQISSYEFRLVGDMTLKQFFQVAGGTVVALILYASPLPAIIKWPLIIISALFGAALAFLPFEERPLSTWIIAFFKAIYSPTLYEWQPNAAEDVYQKTGTGQEPIVVTPGGEEKARRYLASIPVPKVLSVFEEAEEIFFNKIGNLFKTEVTLQPRTPMPQVEEIPSSPPVRVEPVVRPELQTQQAEPVYQPQGISPTLTGQQPQTPASQATFTPEASPPSPPEQPNTVVGQVLTSEGKIVDGAILEIRDSTERPVRALKSNKVGHFMAVTPLPPGEYSIETEKEGFSFELIKFKAEGNIIPSIQIKAK